MSVRGWVQACEWQRRGSELTADAALDAITITVEDITDFDDAGGIISINDQTIAYDEDAIDEDANTILLNTGLAEAATVGDPVYAYSGGQIMRDVVLLVSCGDGEPIEVRVAWEQRDYWPEGDYDDPVQVLLSNDLEKVEDAPGRIPTSTELAEVRGGFEGSLQDIYDAADAAAEAAADAAANATTALTAANGKNKVWVSLSTPGSTPNTAGDIWWQKDSATQTIIGQWNGLGGTSWQSAQVASAAIANLDAGKLVAGSAFTNALSVKTNFTLGDASTNGVIQSYNFAGSSTGIYIDKFGMVAKGGSLAAAAITGSSFTTVAGAYQISIAGSVIAWGDGAYLQSAAGGLTLTKGGSAAVTVSSSNIDFNGTCDFNNAVNVGANISMSSGVIGATRVNGGDVYVTGTPSESGTGLGAVYMGSTGRLRLSSSAAKYKTNIEPLEVDVDQFLELEPVTYDPIDGEDVAPTVGFIADQADELGFTHLVGYRDGEVETLHYERVAAYQQVVLRAQAQQIADLVARIEALEGK